MTQTRHTPGPWEVYDQAIDDGEHYGCSVKSTTDKEADWVAQEIYNRDDARLIAAAPELLEALKLVIDTWGNMPIPGLGKPGTSATAIDDIARAAIAKAEGGQS